MRGYLKSTAVRGAFPASLFWTFVTVMVALPVPVFHLDWQKLTVDFFVQMHFFFVIFLIVADGLIAVYVVKDPNSGRPFRKNIGWMLLIGIAGFGAIVGVHLANPDAFDEYSWAFFAAFLFVVIVLRGLGYVHVNDKTQPIEPLVAQS